MNKAKIIADTVSVLSRKDIRAKKKTTHLTYLRAIYYELCYKILYPKYTLDSIGEEVNKDRCAVLHSTKNTLPHAMNEEAYVCLYKKCLKILMHKLPDETKELREESLVHSLINQRKKIKELEIKLSVLSEFKKEKEHPFINEIKDLDSSQFKIFVERAEVMMKSVKRLRVA